MSHSLEPPYGARDAAGMAARIAGGADRIETALAEAVRTPWRLPITAPTVVGVGGLGGSAIAADLVAGLWSDHLPAPLLTVRDDHWPAWLRPGALAVLSSYSGHTEETLALYDEAGARGVARVALSAGGALAERCARDGVFCVPLPGGSPPRAALFSGWVAMTFLAHALAWIDDPTAAWRKAAARLRAREAEWGPDAPEARNPAKRLARELAGRLPFVYCAEPRLGPVVKRFRNQLNENAKLLAHSEVLPELDHNEIVGWERSDPVADRILLLLVKDAEDSPQARLRMSVTAEAIGVHGVPVREIEERDGGRLARAAALVHFGDYVSLYAALLRGVDPTPIPSIDALKRALAERRSRHAS